MAFKVPQFIEVKKAGRKGLGVFATANISKGHIIEVAPVLAIPEDDENDLLSSFMVRYIFQTDRGLTHVIGLGYSSLLNHAKSPNVDFSVNKQAITLKAVKNIVKGDELTIDYGWSDKDWRVAGIKPVF